MSLKVFWSKLFVTILIWLAVAGLSYLFSAVGHFDGGGAIGLVLIAVLATAGLWYNISIEG